MSAIPNWNAQGLIPPISIDPTSPIRSPYIVSLTDVILRFNTSAPRKLVLDGLLRFRAELHKVGLVSGLQWIDGSFLENIESIESRDPRDVDVVTFFTLPTGILNQGDLVARNPSLFDHAHVKSAYLVDSYPVSMNANGNRLITAAAYWYSMWSHRRGGAWKGFVQVDLNPAHDEIARQLLNAQSTVGGTP